MKKKNITKIFVGILTISVLLMVFCLPSLALEDGETLPAYNKYLNHMYEVSNMKFERARLTYSTSNSKTNRFLERNYGTYFRYSQFVTGDPANMITLSSTPYVDIDEVTINFEQDYSTQVFSDDPSLTINRYVTVYFRMVFENSFESIPEAGLNPNISISVGDGLSDSTYITDIISNNTRVEAYTPDENNKFFIFDVSCSFYIDGEASKIPWIYTSQWIYQIKINFGDSFRFNMLSDELLDGAITTFQVVQSESPIIKNASQYTQDGDKIGDIFIQNEEQIQIDIYNAEKGINKEPINDVVNSAAYRQVASMYQSFWDWSYLETLVLLVLTFGLLSFVLFGKKG